MKRLAVAILTLIASAAGVAQGQDTYYIPIPTIVSGVTATKVEMLRADTSVGHVQATFVAEGSTGVGLPPQGLNVYIGPSTSKLNPLLNLNAIANTGGLVILQPEANLTAIEVSFEVEANPVKTAWKLPLLKAADFFAPNSTVYVQNLIKQADAASNLQIYNLDGVTANCSVQVLRPKGTSLDARTGLTVPPLGVIRIPDILSKAGVGSVGINAAVTCDSHFYAMGAFPAINRGSTRVEYPVAKLPGQTTSVVLDSRPGTFLRVTQDNSTIEVPVNLDPAIDYHTVSINFDMAVVDPPGPVYFRNVVGMYRQGGRRFGKTLYFGSFEQYALSKYVIDLGTPFIETTVKRLGFPLISGKTYHVAITLDNDQRSLHYVISVGSNVKIDVLAGLYNTVESTSTAVPSIQFGLGGVADGAYFPPYGWKYQNLSLVVTK
jgi:hypothetical protein